MAVYIILYFGVIGLMDVLFIFRIVFGGEGVIFSWGLPDWLR